MQFGGAGLGTFPFAGPFTPMDEATIFASLDAYFGAGGSYVDTAPTYGSGAVEALLGRYLKDKDRSTFVLSTSCGYVRDATGYRVSGKPQDVLQDAAESLDCLGLDFFDIYISHIPDPAVPYEQTGAALQALKDQGLAKSIGVSNVDATQLRRYASVAEIAVVQNRASFVNRTFTDAFSDAIRASGAWIVAYQVIERGLLTGGPHHAHRDGDLRARKPEFEARRSAWLQELVVRPLQSLADSSGFSVEQLAATWVLSLPGVALVQLGCTSPEQAARIPQVVVTLDAELMLGLESIYVRATEHARSLGFESVEHFLGLRDYDVRTGSATGA